MQKKSSAENQQIRVRFAPSPTGDPHVGNVRVALFNYLFAKHQGGVFMVRIEDTDKVREVVGAEERIKEGLDWLGLDPDESPWQGGPHTPYRQSERSHLYQTHAQQLVEHAHAYYCFCSSERLANVRVEQEKNHRAPRYDRLCRTIPAATAAKRAKHESHVIRLAVPDHQEIKWSDQIKGELTFQSDEIDDQVLLKSDGFPTYHLANVVDDHLMEISHVLRGEDWLSSTPKHLLLYRAFGWQPPQFGHLSLILGPDKAKLSKRNAHTSLLYYKRTLGIHPQAMLHFMAFLGWTPSHVAEDYTLHSLTKAFTLKRVGSSPAIFDLAKLNSLSRHYLSALTAKDVAAAFHNWLNIADVAPDQQSVITQFQHLSNREPAFSAAIVDVAHLRASNYQEMLSIVSTFLHQHAPNREDLTMQGTIHQDEALQALKVITKAVEQLDLEALPNGAAARVDFLAEYFRSRQPQELAGRAYLHPTRVAITGEVVSMNMFEYLAAFLSKSDGKTTVLQRLSDAEGLLQS